MRTEEGSMRILRDTWVMPGEEVIGCLCDDFSQWFIGFYDGGALFCTSHAPDCNILHLVEEDLLVDHDHWSSVEAGIDGYPAYLPRQDWLDRYIDSYYGGDA